MDLVKVVGYERAGKDTATIKFSREVTDQELEDLVYGVQALVHEVQKRFDIGKLLPGEGKIN